MSHSMLCNEGRVELTRPSFSSGCSRLHCRNCNHTALAFEFGSRHGQRIHGPVVPCVVQSASLMHALAASPVHLPGL